MKNLPGTRDIELALTGGVLDGVTAAGDGRPQDFRILLNTVTDRERGRQRMGGWDQWKSGDGFSNEDLHDQLLGGQGTIEDGVFSATEGQRELVTMMMEAPSTTGAHHFLAATKSRIYTNTGAGRNYRIIADGLGGNYIAGESRWPKIRTRAAQLGDFVVFTNGVNPVLAWPLGGGPIPVASGKDRLWSAREITELIALGILRANVICSWQGFVFLGDVNVEGNDEHGQVYWCSFNRPLEWSPGGESSAGMFDVGRGETILAIAPLGGGLRVHTDQAIYMATFVGGDVIFSFREIYRGDQTVAFRESFVDLGEVHFWLTQESCAILGEYDKTPRRLEWMHKATGYIFNGLDGRLLKNCPVPFAGFNPIDTARCHQIAAGFDTRRSDIWLSWPTQLTVEGTPDDLLDFEGVRRMTIKYNVRYGKATLVDYGFSAFATARLSPWETLRDFAIENGVCAPCGDVTQNVIGGEEDNEVIGGEGGEMVGSE